MHRGCSVSAQPLGLPSHTGLLTYFPQPGSPLPLFCSWFLGKCVILVSLSLSCSFSLLGSPFPERLRSPHSSSPFLHPSAHIVLAALVPFIFAVLAPLCTPDPQHCPWPFGCNTHTHTHTHTHTLGAALPVESSPRGGRRLTFLSGSLHPTPMFRSHG